MAFKEMDPEVVWTLLEGHKDILTPMTKKEELFFKHMTCPTCKSSSLQAFINASSPFSAQSPLPNRLLRCLSCQTEFDPNSGIITKVTAESD
jgi:hypothetical protein